MRRQIWKSMQGVGKSTENTVDFKYLRTTMKNQNWIKEWINIGLKLGNSLYHTLIPHASSLLAVIKIEVYRSIILSAVLMDAKFCLLHEGMNVLLRVFMIGVLRNILVLDSLEKLRKAAISFGVSVRPSAWNNSALTGRIFLKFDIWICFENPYRKFKLH